MRIGPELVKIAVNALERRHWNGTGCGTTGPNACINCAEAMPESAEEVAKIVLSAVLPEALAEDHRRLSRLFNEKAHNVDIYVGPMDKPGDGYRDCALMVTLDPEIISYWDDKRDE